MFGNNKNLEKTILMKEKEITQLKEQNSQLLLEIEEYKTQQSHAQNIEVM